MATKSIQAFLRTRPLDLLSKLFTAICAETSGTEFRAAGTEHDFDPSASDYGACLRLDYGSGTIQVAVFGTSASCEQFVRALYQFGAEEDVPPSLVVDALGETLNLLAGRVKQSVFDACGQELILGLPELFVEQDVRKFTARAIPIRALGITSAQLTEPFEIVCADRSPENLLREILSYLDDSVPDKLHLTRVLGLWEELSESRRETGSDTELNQLNQCVDLIASVINDDSANPREAIHKVAERAQELLAAQVSARELETPPTPSAPPPVVLAFPEFVQLDTDASTVDIVGDIIQEATTGIEEAEKILSAMEQGVHDVEQIHRAFRIFHTIKGNASMWELKELVSLAHMSENLLSKLREGKLAVTPAICSALFRTTGLFTDLIGRLQSAIQGDGKVHCLPGVAEQIGELSRLLESSPSASEAAAAAPHADAVEAPPEPQARAKETVRIEVSAIDRLEQLVSLLGLIERGIVHSVENDDDAPVQSESSLRLAQARLELELICGEMRMVTLGPLLTKVARMVRDVSMKVEKAVRVVIRGEDTRVPRRVFEALSDPFVHLIRNALDHGIETQAERRQTSKSLLATIEIGGHRDDDGTVFVHIRDDGRGLDRSKLLKKAISKGIVREEAAAEMDDSSVYELIFAPGFSTAEQVTAMSGRGVGMDVVKQTIEGLGGRIEIESQLGKGCLFRMVIPPDRKAMARALHAAPEPDPTGMEAGELLSSDSISFL